MFFSTTPSLFYKSESLSEPGTQPLRPKKTPISASPPSWDYKYIPSCLAYLCGFRGIETQVFLLLWKTLCQQSRVLSPSNIIVLLSAGLGRVRAEQALFRRGTGAREQPSGEDFPSSPCLYSMALPSLTPLRRKNRLPNSLHSF